VKKTISYLVLAFALLPLMLSSEAISQPIMYGVPVAHLPADPTTGSGYPATLGTLGVRDGTAQLYIKHTAANTGWMRIDGGGGATGDITAVTAGTGLSGGGTSGAVSVALDGSAATTELLKYDRRVVQWEDDWMLSDQLAQTAGWSGMPIGAAPHSLIMGGAGSTLLPQTGTQRMGIVALGAATATGSARLDTVATLAMDSATFNEISHEAVVAIPTLSTAGEAFWVQVGLIGNAPGYGCYFRYDRENTWGGNAGNVDKWEAVTQEAGVETSKLLDGTGGTVDSPVAASTWPTTNIYRLKVTYTGAAGVGTLATFQINGVTVATINTNLPSHSLASRMQIVRTATAGAVRYLYLDYSKLAVILTAARA
jgi:hypothetical protein